MTTWSHIVRWVRPLRAAAAIVIVSGLALDQAWKTFPRDLPARLAHPDRLRQDMAQHELSLFEQRFQPMLGRLPAHGEVGYAAHVPSEQVLTDGEAVRLYYLTQYVLAPRLMVNDTRRPLVLGNYGTAAEPPPPPGLEVVTRHDGGLVLYREPRP